MSQPVAAFLLNAQFARPRSGPSVTHAIKPALGLAPTGDKIHRTIRAEIEIGDVQRLAAKEHLRCAHVTGPARNEVHGEDASIGPVEDIECLLVIDGKTASGSKFHPGGRALADIDRGLGVVRMIREIWWPASGHGSPTKVRPAAQVLDLRGAIPWSSHVEFRIGIISERLAIRVEVDAVGIAQSATEDFPVGSVRIHANDMTLVFTERIKFSAQRGCTIRYALREVNRVTVDGVDLLIRPQRKVIAPVAAPPFCGVE